MKTLDEIDVDNKRVIVRVDYNVPIINGIIQDNNRIKESLTTINYLISHNCKIILLSHLGRIEKESDKKNNSLFVVSKELSNLLNQEVLFSYETKGKRLEEAVANLREKEVLLVENTRFEDYPNKLESNCDEELSKYWASLGEIFIMDAFGSIHREHASTYGISKYLPSALGFLVKKEIEMLEKIKSTKNKVLVLGGSKVEDKLPLIKQLINTCDYILIGGKMCFTFLSAEGYDVKDNFVDIEKIQEVKDLLNQYKNKIILPLDIMTENLEDVDNISSIGYDIGFKTIQEFKKYLNDELVVINGPLGKFESKRYENGTKYILEYLEANKIKTIILGGDTASACNQFGNHFYYVSTGGGAALEYLSGKRFKILD